MHEFSGGGTTLRGSVSMIDKPERMLAPEAFDLILETLLEIRILTFEVQQEQVSLAKFIQENLIDCRFHLQWSGPAKGWNEFYTEERTLLTQNGNEKVFTAEDM